MTEKKLIARMQNICITLTSIVWALMALMKGVHLSPDSQWYSNAGDLLIKHDFNYFDFLAVTSHEVPTVFYSTWITIVAITKVIFSANWDIAIVAINYIAAIYTLILILKTTRMLTGSPVCVIFACIALIFCHEFYMWIRYVLSDTIFASICFSILFLSISIFQNPSRPQKRIALGLILLSITLFFRPTFPPLIAFILLSTLFGLAFKVGTSDTNKRSRLIINFTIFACVALPVLVLTHSYFMLNPEEWPFSFFKEWVFRVAKEYHLGMVVVHRPETYHSIPNGILDYVFITLSKLISYFAFDFDGYSKIHTLLNYVFFLPIYTLSIFSIALLYKKENGLPLINWWTIFSCFIFIVFFAFFHALQQIDYDLRYRAPCLLPLVLLATLGFNELKMRFFKT